MKDFYAKSLEQDLDTELRDIIATCGTMEPHQLWLEWCEKQPEITAAADWSGGALKRAALQALWNWDGMTVDEQCAWAREVA